MAALDRTGQGKFDTRLPNDGPAELARLGHAFNGMAQQLERAVAENVRLTQEQAVARAITQSASKPTAAPSPANSTTNSARASPPLPRWPAPSSSAAPAAPRSSHSAEVIREVASRMHGDVRALLTRLRPPWHDQRQTLDDAIRGYLASMAPASPGIELVTELFAGPQALPDDITLAALRVVQESCTNIVRHAEAGRARVRLLRDGATLMLEITDNGRGIQPAPGQPGFGLTGMRERVDGLAGSLDISSPSGGRHAHPRPPAPGTPPTAATAPEPANHDLPPDPGSTTSASCSPTTTPSCAWVSACSSKASAPLCWPKPTAARAAQRLDGRTRTRRAGDGSVHARLRRPRRAGAHPRPTSPARSVLIASAHSRPPHRRTRPPGRRHRLPVQAQRPRRTASAASLVAAGQRYIDPDIAAQLRRADRPEHPAEALTDKEFHVFLQLAQGRSVAEVARRFHLSPNTVGTHLYRIKQKLGVQNMAELAMAAVRAGVIEV
jgi:DNA-binding CsgD family transcriptional regulator